MSRGHDSRMRPSSCSCYARTWRRRPRRLVNIHNRRPKRLRMLMLSYGIVVLRPTQSWELHRSDLWLPWEQHHRHGPANLPNSDADRVLVQTDANVPSEECGEVFHQREETQQLFACPVSVETEHRHFRRVHQNSLHANSMPGLSCPHAADTTVAFRADTSAQLCRCCCDDQRQKSCELSVACHDELMWRIEESDSEESRVHRARLSGTSGRRERDEDRDDESWRSGKDHEPLAHDVGHSSDSHPSRRFQRRECGTQKPGAHCLGHWRTRRPMTWSRTRDQTKGSESHHSPKQPGRAKHSWLRGTHRHLWERRTKSQETEGHGVTIACTSKDSTRTDSTTTSSLHLDTGTLARTWPLARRRQTWLSSWAVRARDQKFSARRS